MIVMQVGDFEALPLALSQANPAEKVVDLVRDMAQGKRTGQWAIFHRRAGSFRRPIMTVPSMQTARQKLVELRRAARVAC